jgi:hypothetical protein
MSGWVVLLLCFTSFVVGFFTPIILGVIIVDIEERALKKAKLRNLN